MVVKAIFSILTLLLLYNAEAEAVLPPGVPCAFVAMSSCYGIMPHLGGNMSFTPAETMEEVGTDCKTMNWFAFKLCMETPCPSLKVNLLKATANIISLVVDLCKEKETAQKLINATIGCYKKNADKIKECVPSLDLKANKKALCKSNSQSVKCIKNITATCDKVDADFLDSLITTYNGYAPLVCRACGLNPASLWILAALSIMMISFGLN